MKVLQEMSSPRMDVRNPLFCLNPNLQKTEEIREESGLEKPGAFVGKPKKSLICGFDSRHSLK